MIGAGRAVCLVIGSRFHLDFSSGIAIAFLR
jgi:hypothetical protein